MARHRGKGAVLRIFFVKCGYFYVVLISPLFSKMAEGGDFRSSHL